MDEQISGGDFSQVRAFVAVSQHLSFSRAAAALGVSPSALSQMIRALETRVGTRLLNRTTRSVALTHAGGQLFQRLRPAVSEMGNALAEATQSRLLPGGTLKVHAFRSASQKFLQPMLASFIAAYPDVVVDITLDDEVVDVVAGGYDVAIRLGEVIERDLVAVRLGAPLRQIAVASPGYLAAHGEPQHPRDLVRHRCIRWRWPGTHVPYAWEFFENGGWFEVAVTGALIVNQKELAIAAAIDGIGIAFCMEDAAAQAIHAGQLAPLLDKWCAPFPGLYICYPRQRNMPPALRVFIDALLAARESAVP
ncbi:MAG: LysR family transcriptional regulator [Steroidobacteraceae bacterium]